MIRAVWSWARQRLVACSIRRHDRTRGLAWSRHGQRYGRRE